MKGKLKEQKESLMKFASRRSRSRAIKELPLGKWLSAGREEVVQINLARKLSTLHCTIHVQAGSHLKILCSRIKPSVSH